MEYIAFFLELLAMLVTSGENWLDLQLINLDKKYVPIYLYVFVIFAESMLVTCSRSAQLISCLRLTVTAMFAIWFQDFFSFKKMVEVLAKAQLLFVAFTLLYTLLYPGRSFQSTDTFLNAYRGLFSTKNSCASELSLGIVLTAYLVREDFKTGRMSRLWLIGLGIQVVMLVSCQATGALLTTVLVLALMVLLPSKRRFHIGWIYIAINLLFLFSMLTLMPLFSNFIEMLGKDATLTGRIPLWNHVITFMMNNNTLTGYGYGMFWQDIKAVALFHYGFAENSYLQTMTSGAHNVLMEAWLNMGLIGIGALFLALIVATSEPEEIPEGNYHFSAILLAFLMMNGLTERVLHGTYDCRTLMLLLLLALCCNRPPKKKASRLHGEKQHSNAERIKE